MERVREEIAKAPTPVKMPKQEEQTGARTGHEPKERRSRHHAVRRLAL
jgi:hypothetical protein